MASKHEPWNGKLGDLRENHITCLIIDFKQQTVEAYVDNPFYGQTGGMYEPVDDISHLFTNSSPFGQISRGLRRMISNEYSKFSKGDVTANDL